MGPRHPRDHPRTIRSARPAGGPPRARRGVGPTLHVVSLCRRARDGLSPARRGARRRSIGIDGNMSRLRILHAAKFYPPVHGGMERIIGELCEGTASTWDTRVVAANDRPRTIEERVAEVDVIRAARFGSTNSVPICPSLAGHLWRRSADCVVLHEPNPIAAGA